MKIYWKHLVISSTFESRKEIEQVCLDYMALCGAVQQEVRVILALPDNIIHFSLMTEAEES